MSINFRSFCFFFILLAPFTARVRVVIAILPRPTVLFADRDPKKAEDSQCDKVLGSESSLANRRFLESAGGFEFDLRSCFLRAITSLWAQPPAGYKVMQPLKRRGRRSSSKRPSDLGAGESRYGIPAAAPRLVFALQSAPRSVQPTGGEEQREVNFYLAALLTYFCRRGSPHGSLRDGEPAVILGVKQK